MSTATTQDIKAATRRFIADNFIMGSKAKPYADGDSFIDRHIMDSTGFLELITHLEETYGLTIGDDEMVPENLDSLNAIETFVQRKQGAA